MTVDDKPRCFGNFENKPLLAHYHDTEWGVPVHDDLTHFEFLILEGAQAGLNWETILAKREGYRRVFKGFDPQKVARISDEELESARQDASIVRNKLKIYAARRNARAFLAIQEEFDSFDAYVWDFVDGSPIVGQYAQRSDVPATTPVSDALSRDLKKRGMTFVGSTIIYAYMQAVGLVDDHFDGCWKRAQQST